MGEEDAGLKYRPNHDSAPCLGWTQKGNNDPKKEAKLCFQELAVLSGG